MSLVGLASLDEGTLRVLGRLIAAYGDELPPSYKVEQVVQGDGAAVVDLLGSLKRSGWIPSQLALAVEALAVAKSGVTPVPGMEYVLSGPTVSNVPMRDTAAVVQTLFADAEEEVTVVGYAFYKGEQIFRALADRWRERPGMRVRFIVDIRRTAQDRSIDEQLVSRFVSDFRKRQWPWTPAPEILYDPRALRAEAAQRAALHAKCVIIDRRIALVTSANFTPAAQERNVEVGVLLREPLQVQQLSDFFVGLAERSLVSA